MAGNDQAAHADARLIALAPSLARAVLAAEADLAALRAERERLREAIRVYVETEDHRKFDAPGKIAKCSHGCYSWEECAQCNSEWFSAALAPEGGTP